MVEYLIVIAIVGVAAIGTWTVFGDSITGKTDGQAEAIRTMAGDRAGGAPPISGPSAAPEATGGASGALTSGGAPSAENPGFGDFLEGKGTYVESGGRPFEKGDGDRRKVDPSDVSQGQIGDCYFIASLATVAARNPELIEKNIRKLDDGSYGVTLYERNEEGELVPREIVVSAEFPSSDGSTPAFAQTGDERRGEGEIWPALYEKAYAQMHGSYNDIGHGGWPRDAMTAITGVESVSSDGISVDDIADTLERGDSVVGWTPSSDAVKDNPLFQDSTLYADHAYWVVSADREAGTVTVRNPWGWSYEEITLTEEQYKEAFPYADTNATSEAKPVERPKPWWQFW